MFPEGVTELLQLLDLLEEPLEPPDALFDCADAVFESSSYVSSSSYVFFAILGRTFLARACGWTTFALPLFSFGRAKCAHLLAGHFFPLLLSANVFPTPSTPLPQGTLSAPSARTHSHSIAPINCTLDGDYGGHPQCQGQAFLLLTFSKQNGSL